MTKLITDIEELTDILDDFLQEIEVHPGYKSIISIIQNPVIQLLSDITGYQPGYFAKPINDGDYVVFDLEKIRTVKNRL